LLFGEGFEMDDDLGRRALAAYYRQPQDFPGAVWNPPHPSSPDVVEHNGRQYVVLHNVNGTLAVYRVRNTGQLRRLRRWPAEVADR
jgi:hypothetical protein